MRIAIVSTYKVQCGIATYTDYLGNALRERGHTVLVFAEDLIGNDSLEPDVFTLPFIRCWNRKGNLIRLKDELLKWKPDIIHVQHETALFERKMTFSNLCASLNKEIPVIITFHIVSTDEYFGKLASRISCTIVHINRMLQELSKSSMSTGSMMTMIPHGSKEVHLIDNLEAKRKVGIPEHKKVVSVFGFVGKYKGHYLLMSILSKMIQLEPDLFLLFAGGIHPIMPENVKHHMDIIKRTSDANPDHVRMTGYIPDSEMDTYISASDIIMFPHIIYAASSISGAVHRVIDSGKPILASTFPLYDDLINGVSCLKLPENLNLYSMPTLISEVLHDDKLMSHIGNGAKKLAEDTSWKVVAEMTEVVYRKVVERAGGNF